MGDTSKPFDRVTIELAFERLGELARKAGKIVEISVYGGSALVLTTDFRVGTQDVDAVFENDRAFVRQAAAIVADEFGWNSDWINDGVKGFLRTRDATAESKLLFRTYPVEHEPGLRVFVAIPEYLFAMKCLAMRLGGVQEDSDVTDVRKLGAELGVRSARDAFEIVSRYYPLARLSPKT